MFVVAGVSGHVGKIVATTLITAGEKVRVVVRDAAKGVAWAAKGAEVVVGSLDDGGFVARAFAGAEGAFVLLPPPAFSEADFFAAQKRVADAIVVGVKESRLPHVVLLSSVGAELPSGTGPIRGLHYLEEALRGTGTKLTAIRAGYFQENLHNVVGAAKGAGIFPSFFPSADVEIPMIATRDIGALAAKELLARPAKGEIIDLHGPAYSARQLADKLGAALGRTITVVDIPQAEWLGAMTESGLPLPFAKVFAEMYAGFSTGAIRPVGDRFVQGNTPIDEVIATATGAN